MRRICLTGMCLLLAEGLWAAPPQVVVNASRVSGVAPLGVFFDASGTTDLTNNDFLQAHFSWDFGDPGSGVWEYTGRSANEATGFITAHVFETPGTYTVTVGVLDVARQTGSGTTTITVLDPEDVYSGNHTRCVSRTGDFTGAPTAAELVTSTDLDAQIDWLNGAPNRRLLLRRGEVWVNCSAFLNTEGPNTWGSFGPGDAPRLELADMPGEDDCVNYSGNDLRVMDLEFDGTAVDRDTLISVYGSHGLFAGINAYAVQGQTLIANGIGGGWNVGGTSTNSFLYRSKIKFTRYFGSYADGLNMAFLGSEIDQIRLATGFGCDDPNSPACRGNGYVANCLINASRDNMTTGIKYHARRGVMTDNVMVAGSARIALSDSGGNGGYTFVDVNLGMALIERNIFRTSGEPVKDAYNWTAVTNGESNVVMRNNLVYDMPIAFSGFNAEYAPNPATNVHILNNSVYMRRATPGGNVGEGDFFNASEVLADWHLKNNVVYSLNSLSNGGTCNGWCALLHIIQLSGIESDHNLFFKATPDNTPFAIVGEQQVQTFSDWQQQGADTHSLWGDPGFSGINPADPGDSAFGEGFFALTDGSPAIGTGELLAVFEDFNRNPRLSDVMDMGAVRHFSTAPQPPSIPSGLRIGSLMGTLPRAISLE